MNLDKASNPWPQWPASEMSVALLTGGDDKPYVLGLTAALMEAGVCLAVVGSDSIDSPELHESPSIQFLNLRGDQREDAPFVTKLRRIILYYFRLMAYAARAKPKIFHILWNNKFEWFDRTLLMLYYKVFAKRILLTAHNVNAAKRDSRDSFVNRLTLWIQYRLCDRIFVHSDKMAQELSHDFGVIPDKVVVIPFGINATNSSSSMRRQTARDRLALDSVERVVLFFGQIAPYKGLEYLVDALAHLKRQRLDVRLIIAGRVKSGCSEYWDAIRSRIVDGGFMEQVIQKICHIPDDEVEVYFKAADAVILPYINIFQSGVPFLAYNFGLPVIASDVGSLREDISEGETGFICKPRDSLHLAQVIQCYFSSDLYQHLEERRVAIRTHAQEKYSWSKVGSITTRVYSDLLGLPKLSFGPRAA